MPETTIRLSLLEEFLPQARRVLGELSELPAQILDLRHGLAAMKATVAENKERLAFEIEPVLRLASVEGKNAEEREALFKKAAGADEDWKANKQCVITGESALASEEAMVDELQDRQRNARAQARLLTALLSQEEEDNGHD